MIIDRHSKNVKKMQKLRWLSTKKLFWALFIFYAYTVYSCVHMYCTVHCTVYIRVECGNCFWSVRSGQLTRVRYDFRSPNPNFGLPCTGGARQSYFFFFFQGVQILIFVDENWHAAFFYIKEQTQKYKFEICVSIVLKAKTENN